MFYATGYLVDDSRTVSTTTGDVDVEVGSRVVIDIVGEWVNRQDAILVLLAGARNRGIGVVRVDPDLAFGRARPHN